MSSTDVPLAAGTGQPVISSKPETDQKNITIALAGNPNSGKTTLFNSLTGLNQKVGNYPGVTVERKSGKMLLPNGKAARLVDLPGTYSIYARSGDEQVVTDILLNPRHTDYPDVIVAVADMSNLERSLLLVSQLIDLGLPLVLVLNMADMAGKKGILVNADKLGQLLGNIPVLIMNARTGAGLDELKEVLQQPFVTSETSFYNSLEKSPEAIAEARHISQSATYYGAYLYLQQPDQLHFLPEPKREQLQQVAEQFKPEVGNLQIQETKERYAQIAKLLQACVTQSVPNNKAEFTAKIDAVFTHKIFGYLIFFGLLLLVFQSIFAWAEMPMDLIDELFASVGGWLQKTMPEGLLRQLVVEGIVPGIGGIVIFVPQIAILFTLIAILEETGYMARVVFLMDRLMRKVGLNGRSVVPLISGLACAVPAIMAARGIDNWKDRLITIFVTPFMSCSARLPVYTILIALVVPNDLVWGFLNLQGLALLGMYMLGFLAALGTGFVMKYIIKAKRQGFLIMELPTYRWPRWKNVLLMVVQKSKAFVFEAGKIILAVSIILWVLASYGPSDKMDKAAAAYRIENAKAANLENEVASLRLANSYAGHLGRFIEPAIKPLGYDWKIGIALISSFAAREVFVSTMATLYSVGEADDDDKATIKQQMRAEINPDTGKPRFTLAVAFSLLVFYAFAMQCSSTVAIVYRETNGWKWPLIQVIYMTSLAWIAAFVVYQVLS